MRAPLPEGSSIGPRDEHLGSWSVVVPRDRCLLRRPVDVLHLPARVQPPRRTLGGRGSCRGGGAATVYLAKLRAPPAQVLAALTAGDVLEKEEYGRCAGEEMSEQSTEQREEEWG